MTLYDYPSQPAKLKDLKVNWTRTKAWSTGSAGQIYLNLKGREPQGIVDSEEHDGVIDELVEKIEGIPDERGKSLNTRVFRRDDIHSGPYAEYGPDLFVSFDGYHWSTSELVGYGKIYSFDIEQESDDSSHSLCGYFCIAGPGVPPGGELKGVSLLNSAPTVLDVMGLKIPEDMESPSILEMAQEKEEIKPPQKDKEAVRSRLDLLGY